MSTTVWLIVTAIVWFGLGYWIAGHPADFRTFTTRARDRIVGLFHKPPTPPTL